MFHPSIIKLNLCGTGIARSLPQIAYKYKYKSWEMLFQKPERQNVLSEAWEYALSEACKVECSFISLDVRMLFLKRARQNALSEV